MSLRKHFCVIRDDHALLTNLRRKLLSLGEYNAGKFTRRDSMINVEWQHPEISHGQVTDTISYGILGQGNGGHVDQMIRFLEKLQVASGIAVKLILRVIQADEETGITEDAVFS